MYVPLIIPILNRLFNSLCVHVFVCFIHTNMHAYNIYTVQKYGPTMGIAGMYDLAMD